VLPHATVSGGVNTIIDSRGIVSAIEGKLINANNVLDVEEVLIIKGQVGYGTGHISFPGDVVIEGFVADGFKIKSGASVMAKQTFDATDVSAKKDLVVSGGIIGRGPGLIKTGGCLRAKFLRNCRAASRETIHVNIEIINSKVFTLDSLDMGDKGRILGGEIYAVHGIRAGSIGKKSGRFTSLHCGIDFTVVQEKERLNYRMRALNGKLNKLEEILEKDTGPHPAKFVEMVSKIREEIERCAVTISELMTRVNADESATVEAFGTISPGTLIEICAASFLVQSPLKKVRLRLDAQAGSLVQEPLKN
jgi:uncharacterized protein (DUF342 family)